MDFECKRCAKSFGNKFNLERHLQKKTQCKCYCKICELEITTYSNLQKHLKTKSHLDKCTTNEIKDIDIIGNQNVTGDQNQTIIGDGNVNINITNVEGSSSTKPLTFDDFTYALYEEIITDDLALHFIRTHKQLCVAEMFRHIHLNKELPQNINILSKTTLHKCFKLYLYRSNNKWEITIDKSVLLDTLNTIKDIIFDQFKFRLHDEEKFKEDPNLKILVSNLCEYFSDFFGMESVDLRCKIPKVELSEVRSSVERDLISRQDTRDNTVFRDNYKKTIEYLMNFYNSHKTQINRIVRENKQMEFI